MSDVCSNNNFLTTVIGWECFLNITRPPALRQYPDRLVYMSSPLCFRSSIVRLITFPVISFPNVHQLCFKYSSDYSFILLCNYQTLITLLYTLYKHIRLKGVIRWVSIQYLIVRKIPKLWRNCRLSVLKITLLWVVLNNLVFLAYT